MEKHIRNSNIEILRIIAILMIIASHYAHGFSGSNSINLGFGINRYFYSVFTAFGQVGVGIFILIMGYFMVEQKVTLKRFLKLYVDVIFYSLIIFVLFAMFNREAITLKLTVKSFLPTIYVNWWYFTAYAIIMILSPWLNKLLKALEKDEYEKLLFVLFAIFTLSRFAYHSLADGTSGFAFGKLIPCFNLYILGAYLKLHVSGKVTSGQSGGGYWSTREFKPIIAYN